MIYTNLMKCFIRKSTYFIDRWNKGSFMFNGYEEVPDEIKELLRIKFLLTNLKKLDKHNYKHKELLNKYWNKKKEVCSLSDYIEFKNDMKLCFKKLNSITPTFNIDYAKFFLELHNYYFIKDDNNDNYQEIIKDWTKSTNKIEYIAENLDNTVKYSEYIAENLDNTVKYSEYIAENLDNTVENLIANQHINYDLSHFYDKNTKYLVPTNNIPL